MLGRGAPRYAAGGADSVPAPRGDGSALTAPRHGSGGLTRRDYLAYLFPSFCESALLIIGCFLSWQHSFPGGPFPLLQLIGPKGTAKSTTARIIKALTRSVFGRDERGIPRNESRTSQYTPATAGSRVSAISPVCPDGCRMLFAVYIYQAVAIRHPETVHE